MITATAAFITAFINDKFYYFLIVVGLTYFAGLWSIAIYWRYIKHGEN